MARYEHLPIYKQAMDVAVYFEEIVAGFSRCLHADERCFRPAIVTRIFLGTVRR